MFIMLLGCLFSYYWVSRVLYIFWTKFIKYMFWNINFQPVTFLFIFLTLVFKKVEVLNLVKILYRGCFNTLVVILYAHFAMCYFLRKLSKECKGALCVLQFNVNLQLSQIQKFN